LSREETAYLWEDDLMATWENDPDNVFQFLETCVEDFMIWLSSRLKKVVIPIEHESKVPLT
jgi:hypothetical protein